MHLEVNSRNEQALLVKNLQDWDLNTSQKNTAKEKSYHLSSQSLPPTRRDRVLASKSNHK